MTPFASFVGLIIIVADPGPFGADHPPPVTITFDAAPGVLTARERQAWRSACRSVVAALGAPPPPWRISVARAASPADFQRRTGRPRFTAAAWSGDTLWLQARDTLARFSALQAVRRHECVHAWRSAIGLAPLPVVVEEGLAAGVAAEPLPPRSPATKADARRALAARLEAPRSWTDAIDARAVAKATVWPQLRALTPQARRRRLQAISDRARGVDWWVILIGNPAGPTTNPR